MRTVYRGELPVVHGRFHVDSRPEPWAPVPSEACAGQTNGLCGAAVPGCLFLCTGLSSGKVALTVEVHGTAPPLDDRWEDVVEASFRPLTASTAVLPCGRGALCEWALPTADHRVRYCGRGMDGGAGAASATVRDAGPVGQYLLQFWPAPPTADRVVRQTSRSAAHRHRCARALEPTVPGARTERERAEIRSWGGRLPSRRVREAGADARGLVPLDRELLDAVDAACPATQRGLARWAARRALTAAGLDGVDWIAPALAALDRGEPLPAPFDDPRRAWDRFFTDARTALTAPGPPGAGQGAPLCRALALPALRAAADPDPLRAALGALFAAAVTHGTDYPGLFAEARRCFPDLRADASPQA
ncbi:hypothetical protein SAMN05428941_0959 [Streptomyces sp. 2114.2]|uniref:Uncharacterized protein n=1 Tax=Streptomyces violaceolatus TaxID=67378 RepID=A0ABN3S5Q8_9ACTN|nr:hypothetical protein [Streptomyces sp. 2114.2]REH19220.1 hypothetical protein BX268_0958 [Streptomyces sp. 2221.1]WTC13556.1 hypothetical protein OHA15_05290 [Streptomyces anthocyanicus]SDS69052.1 hypothetical protein SAMN05428941_0959 [Streptomyces sp. 2114.2]